MNQHLSALCVALVLVFSGCSYRSDADGQGAAEAAGSNTDTSDGALSNATPAPESVTTVDPTLARDQAETRAVVVMGNGCGDAGGALGSGVAISDSHVLTAAHVIIGASAVSVSRRADHPPTADVSNDSTAVRVDRDEILATPAVVVAFDPLRDLALLEVELSELSASPSEPTFGVLQEDQSGTIIGGLTSGDVSFTIADKTIIDANEIRGDRRSERSGYRLDAETARGDSGAGLYDERGRFVGLLFAVSSEDSTRSWATAGDEIEAFLKDSSVAGTFECNPSRSKLERR